MADSILKGKKVGFAMCGSFCTFKNAFEQLEKLISLGADIIPIMSFNASTLDTKFGRAKDHVQHMELLTGRPVIKTIQDAEPIGPQKLTDIMLVANCTGNTLAKLAYSITDTPVTMAVKSHLRSSRPVVLSIATNDALMGTAKNIGHLLSYKNYFFVPMQQDDMRNKPTSLVSDFERTIEALEYALIGKQLQPVIG
jgi:dipicolinate synthase subunit B